MNIAFLFNADYKSLGSYYGLPIMKKILQSNIIQNSSRHMRILIGDILTYDIASKSANPTYDNLEQICKKVYIPKNFNHLKIDLLINTFRSATVFCWVFQNMTKDIGLKLNNFLFSEKYYLGSMDVSYDYGPHLVLFRNFLCENYGIFGRQCHIFYRLSENEDPDIFIKKIFEEYGFIVDFEDVGARRTIFDDYDTLEHFTRVEDFKNIFSKISRLTEDIISNIVFFLEELHPKLFDAFASAARTLERAETEEDFAQVAISGRRLIEQLADYLFPPRVEKYNNRDVSKDKFKNRIWAYIEDTMKECEIEDESKLNNLGQEVEHLLELFNKGLHSNISKEKIEKAFTELILWMYELIELSPKSIKRPYLAYEDKLNDFIAKALMK